MKSLTIAILVFCIAVLLVCSKSLNSLVQTNPLDGGGTNNNPPTVIAMADAVVNNNDSLLITATARDNESIKSFFGH